jgi:Asp-tRNA(Asn)/Glu-tRNA(Gln) amidotransferase C subunit
MTAAKIAKIVERIKALEADATEPDGVFWQLLKQMREDRGLPPPDPLNYGHAGRDAVNELFEYFRENADEYEKELAAAQSQEGRAGENRIDPQ